MTDPPSDCSTWGVLSRQVSNTGLAAQCFSFSIFFLWPLVFPVLLVKRLLLLNFFFFLNFFLDFFFFKKEIIINFFEKKKKTTLYSDKRPSFATSPAGETIRNFVVNLNAHLSNFPIPTTSSIQTPPSRTLLPAARERKGGTWTFSTRRTTTTKRLAPPPPPPSQPLPWTITTYMPPIPTPLTPPLTNTQADVSDTIPPAQTNIWKNWA